MSLYPGLVARSVLDIRMKLGMSRISLNYRQMINCLVPVLVVDCFSDRGKLYTLRYNLPPVMRRYAKNLVSGSPEPSGKFPMLWTKYPPLN